jgi:excisionase family DNA binding protein
MTVPAAAKYLEVSTTLIYDLCARGDLAHHRLGIGRGTIRVIQADLDAYMAKCRVECGSRPTPQPLLEIRPPATAPAPRIRLIDAARARVAGGCS